MKIIFLNCWYGKVGKPFFDFVDDYLKDSDICCLTEVNPELHKKIGDKLTNFANFYQDGIYDPRLEVNFGQSFFVKNDLNFKFIKKISAPIDPVEKLPFAFTTTYEVTLDNKKINIALVHGMALPGSKLDSLARLKQSDQIIEYMKGASGPQIVIGDFNLLPDTESIKKFEVYGYQNLIEDFAIKSTRNRIAWEQFKNEPGFVKQHYADYCFVSKDVKVKKFTVPNIEVSDHLPLILEFEV
ncbi:hypothetical protein A2130_00475 [Candidatus Woesebacteria bacterium GWC2_33_12]|uniref:Endonuclease/exonuclease/phosphatase domain-containing protein n=1 Tax=Candidatus Woesebacteria bacterium GW2011_GWB1_33_22 TaxID=1618566 RepID=A0A0F9ZIR8_9BACT|nr:MAG: hypothetical protein UR29_C0008G0044 [Candidatus Woesebacteria bacterium GW2011_GWC2_33_12]KKP41546.1 MAG: hypothetical protein UR33_C0013G0024 [Candidatus Woesebacteria bacterium GW2011_GWA2_33_20]KKP43999.1 MAG: hypothetical protein UR35_C0013G0024 [Candidatus Woesebacteria bacterium GW2011_GWB1_33_22]KKP46560.1 MAG: hypothetical protein UR37_C0006G0010 [Microgenomates group bacterium GW2011_GWC1_33_28]KKP49477.1 MAG: hypothetical protein UR41_C0014G0024 [Candidatus Woesebacteria bact